MNKRFAKLPALVLTLVVGALGASSTMGQATIVIENFDQPNVGFNDATAAAPIGGNPGTTVGQQRLNAFQHAASIWGATLPSGPTITIRASWDPSLTCGASSGTLGTAGSITIHRNFAGASFPNTWFGGALANTLAGVDLDPASPEIRARFNPDIGTAGECLQNSHWYYGLDTNDPNPFGSINLVTVLLHEFAHGLGFQTFTSSSTGTQNNGFPSIYDRFLFDNTTNKNWTQMTDAERVASAINSGNLVWIGPQVLGDATLLSSGKDAQGHPRLFAPNPVQGGSSVSHWDTVLTPSQLMEPNISGGLSHSVGPPQDLTFSLLRDIGWCVSNCPPPPPPPSPTPTPSPPVNDNFANAQLISGCSGSVSGTNVAATKEPGEPFHEPDDNPGGRSVWYQWTAPASTDVTITTAGSDYDTLLGVYTGNAVGSLTLIKNNDDVELGIITTSTVTFPANAGTTYKIAVDGFNFEGEGAETGNITLNWSQSNCSTPTPTPTPQGPTIFLEEGSVNQAMALDSVTLLRGPFRILTEFNFSGDHHTRVILFTSDLGLSQPDPSKLTVSAGGSSLLVENVGTVTGVTGLVASYIIVRLPDGLSTGDLPLIVTLNGAASSNSPTLTISP